ncbi:hypothetical protein GP486_005848 [Trichoglossum hirsutum]|uniref:Uncharacterized protein n=1 Tax=Trichoglossum hirsutum TaxID=265104 RepID=A0A9P8L8G9_9PEZI|nr:hypothetical protein GP486_005848 [Trichoglossum hirsutum]
MTMENAKVDRERSQYLEWFHAAGFRMEGEIYESINQGLQRYRSGHSKEEGRARARVMVPTIEVFTELNCMVERWPMIVMKELNKTGRQAQSEPFNTWARPRDFEKRKQAVAVWYNMISFIEYHWDYDSKRLAQMGLCLTEEMKQIVDNISLYARTTPKAKAMKEAVQDFCTIAVMDGNASVGENPLLWWIAVVMQSEVFDKQARLPIAGMEDELDFKGKLEALDHYARVLILDFAFTKWSRSASRADLAEVQGSLNSKSIKWVDEDGERPPEEELEGPEGALLSFAWLICIPDIRCMVDKWLVMDSLGPMDSIIRLMQGCWVGKKEKRKHYKYVAKMQIYEDFTYDPVTSGVYSCGTKNTVERANAEARISVEDELGSPEEAVKWDEVRQEDGRIKIRAVYIDAANNAKVEAWVEKIEVDDEDTGKEIASDDDEEMEM